LLCSLLKTCSEYNTERKYSSQKRFRCTHKLQWEKCTIYLERKNSFER